MTDAQGTEPAVASAASRADQGSALASRLGVMAIELAVIAAVWWLLQFPVPFAAGLAAVVVAHNIVPERFSSLAMGVALLGFAAYLALQYNWWRIPTVIGLFGLIALAAGVVSLRRGE